MEQQKTTSNLSIRDTKELGQWTEEKLKFRSEYVDRL